MPLVFAENELTESGITYDDRTGISYEFPKMYRRIIVPGEPFVYYRGRKTRKHNRVMPVYFGSGVVGKIVGTLESRNRLICEVLSFKPFTTPVPFKRSKSDYLEAGGKRRGYFQRGVRRISEAEFKNILDAAGE